MKHTKQTGRRVADSPQKIPRLHLQIRKGIYYANDPITTDEFTRCVRKRARAVLTWDEIRSFT